jgi:hypothetical protein
MVKTTKIRSCEMEIKINMPETKEQFLNDIFEDEIQYLNLKQIGQILNAVEIDDSAEYNEVKKRISNRIGAMKQLIYLYSDKRVPAWFKDAYTDFMSTYIELLKEKYNADHDFI